MVEQGGVLGSRPAIQFGTAARSYDELRAPNFYNESFGLMRRIKLAEKATLTFRGEFFNVFNRAVFGAPVANIQRRTSVA